MGLTSIHAIRLSAVLKKTTGITVRTGDLLAHPKIREWEKMTAGKMDEIEIFPARESYPLRANQLGIFLDWEQNRTGLQYNIPVVQRFENRNAEKLYHALEKVLETHSGFKTRIEKRSGDIVQVRRDSAKLNILLKAIDFEPDAKFFQERVRPFDLLNGDLARFEIYAAPAAVYLFADVHHIIFDGGSVDIFLSALEKTYHGGEPEPEIVTACDYALFCEKWRRSEKYTEAGNDFKELISGTEPFQYPSACNRAEESGKAAACHIRIPRQTIRSRCRELGITENVFFAAVLCQVFHRIGRTDAVQIATVSSGRSPSQLHNTIGMFVQTLPLVSKTARGCIADILISMQQQIVRTMKNELFPYVDLVEKYRIKPNVLYVYQGGVIQANANLFNEGIPLALDNVKIPLGINVIPEEDTCELLLEYDTGLYTLAEMERLAKVIATFAMEMASAGKDTDASRLALVSETDKQRLLALGTGKKLDFDHAETLVDRFLKNAKRFPRSTAVSDAVSTLAYDELDRQSDVLAAELRKRGIRENDFVAVKLPRIKEFVLSVIGIWKAGGAYVPVDPEYPAERISYMLEDSGAKVVIDEEFFRKNDLSGQTSPVNFAYPDSLAYMIYTSGSTGKPKGVMIPHISVRALTEWLLELTQADRHDVFAHYASFSFDASVIDFTTALAAGAAVCILDDATRKDMNALHHYFSGKHIAGVALPTQFGMTLLNEFEDLPLRFLIMGGEKMKAVPKHRTCIINGYGPTEFTVCSSYHIVDPEQDGDDIPIGRPVPNSISAIIDPSGNLLPRGMTGELVLLGTQIARGYFHRPELTAERFTDAPFLSGQKMYRTGDLARWDEKGELRYQGRIDNQVKLRGFRIEMGEIEAALAKYPGINDAVADVRMISGLPHLAAYYVSAAEIDEKALKSELAKSLAEYMVPELYLRLEKMPLTPNGKIDRKALPEPEPDSMPDTYAAPDTETEKIICRIFGDALKIKRFGAETDFFMAGGTSILGIRVVAELQRRKFNVVYGDIFKCRTPRTLAAFLTKPPEKQNEDANAVDYGDYDYSRIDAALQKTRSDLFTDFETHPLGDVLLTGATGYLGIHILKQLLDSTECRICLLIRAKKNMPPEKRLAAQYVYYFDDLFPEEYRKRLVFVNGDITDWDLHAKLSVFPYNTVINCAAIVKHYIADDKMDQANVQGVRNLIDCCIKDQARLIQISTYSVGGVVGSASNQMLDERHLYIGQTSDNDYVRTKFLAERCLLEEIASGRLKGKIMRLGNLMGRESDGEFQINTTSNAFVNSLKTFSILGAYPLMRLTEQVEMSPIDRVAEAVLKLSSTPDDMLVFQPYNTYHMDMGAILKALGKNGHKIEYISDSDFAARVDALRNDPARVKFLQGILHYGGHILANRTMTRPVNTWTTTVLYRLGFHWNQPDDRYLDKFLQILEGMRVFQQ